jgi:TRAP-type C4-dicarboxylate transport system substrate-binding protein
MLRHVAVGARAAIVALAMGVAGVAAQAAPVHLRISHWVPPTHPLQKALENWAKEITADSKGTITATIYPSQQLGKAFDHYDMARDGIADITFVEPAYQPGRFPIIGAAQLPFLVANAKGGTAALDKWYRHYAKTEMADVHYCLAFALDPGRLFAKSKITLPSQLQGMKIRPAGETMAALDVLLGATNVSTSAPEARDAVARGVADAMWFNPGSLILFGIEKILTYEMDMPTYTIPFVIVMNKRTYQGLTPDQKKVMDKHCSTEDAVKIASPWVDFERNGGRTLASDPNFHVYEPSADQIAEWRKAAAPLTEKWREEVTKAGLKDPDMALSSLEAELKQNGALFGQPQHETSKQ